MNNFINTLAVSSLIVFIELYSEIHLKNYGRLTERLSYVFGIKTIFNVIKLSIAFSFSYIFFDFEGIFGLFSLKFIQRRVIEIDFSHIWDYLIIPFSITIFIILFNSKELYKHFRPRSILSERLNQFLANLKYIIFRGISYVFTFAIFSYILKYTILLDQKLGARNLSVFDWLTYTKDEQDNYNKGTYFSLLLTIFIFIVFNNSFIKKNSDAWNHRRLKFDFFKYFFITLVLSIGLFFGFFSIFNASYNIFNTSLSQWISKENILGILPIRISSVLIITHLLSYIYKEVLDRKVTVFLVLGLLPIRNLSIYNRVVNFESRETLFFSQIAFYILNIALAEMFIMIGFKSNFLAILNFAILFILDDFIIITEYSKNLRVVKPSHFFRVQIFNVLMLVVSIVILLNKSYYIILGGYLIITILLFIFYRKNFRSINLRDPV